VEVKHTKAEGMEADGFSKPYDPVDHKKFAMKGQMHKWKQWVGAEQSGNEQSEK
jgi:hypothetical protein